MENRPGQEEFVRQILAAYRQTPGTLGKVRRADRLLAAQLYQRGLSVKVIENALVLAAARRLIRPTDRQPLNAIRSLAYFLPVIEEVLESRVSPEYFHTCVTSWCTSRRQSKFNLSTLSRMIEKQDARFRRGR